MKAFVDTNLFLYAIDPQEKTKRKKAQQVVESLVAGGQGVVSTQVINEFCVNAIRKLGRGEAQVKKLLNVFDDFEIVSHNLSMIREGLDICGSTGLNYWDAILIAAARSAKCATLYTEDMSHGQSVAGVKIVNPFA
ncbi:MAG: PIN domain-containing protein [Armatimonadetes bacterium]|nr:PIN domain-containing protein [Armatimonadota bacterium]